MSHPETVLSLMCLGKCQNINNKPSNNKGKNSVKANFYFSIRKYSLKHFYFSVISENAIDNQVRFYASITDIFNQFSFFCILRYLLFLVSYERLDESSL